MAWASSYRNGECTVAKKIMTPQIQIKARALTLAEKGELFVSKNRNQAISPFVGAFGGIYTRWKRDSDYQ